MKRIVLSLLAVLALTACAPDQGDIVKKKYEPAHTWYSTEYEYRTETYSCPKTQTTTVNGKTTTRTYTGTCTRQVQTGSHQVPHYEPERFRLKIDDGGDTGWVSVPERTYDRAKVGDYYDNGDVRDAAP